MGLRSVICTGQSSTINWRKCFFMYLTLCTKSVSCWNRGQTKAKRKIESTLFPEVPLYAVVLRFPFTGTKGLNKIHEKQKGMSTYFWPYCVEGLTKCQIGMERDWEIAEERKRQGCRDRRIDKVIVFTAGIRDSWRVCVCVLAWLGCITLSWVPCSLEAKVVNFFLFFQFNQVKLYWHDVFIK